jgi:hypothetical protein
VRAAVRAENAYFALLGREFRVYAHDPAALEAAARDVGLHRLHRHSGAVWESVAFTRA